MGYKQGRFTHGEQEFIKSNIAHRTPDELASELNRDPISVRAYIKRNQLIKYTPDGVSLGDGYLLEQLTNESFYKSIKKQLDPIELEEFQLAWVESMEELGVDVRFTEKIQLKQLILLDIFMNRINVQKQIDIERIEYLQEELKAELRLARELRDTDMIKIYQTEVASLRLSVKESVKNYNDLLREYKHVQKVLSGARAERVDKINNSTSNFVGWLTLLEDRKVREQIGKEWEIFRMAKEKEAQKLSELHTFEDGEVDLPIISAETVA